MTFIRRTAIRLFREVCALVYVTTSVSWDQETADAIRYGK